MFPQSSSAGICNDSDHLCVHQLYTRSGRSRTSTAWKYQSFFSIWRYPYNWKGVNPNTKLCTYCGQCTYSFHNGQFPGILTAISLGLLWDTLASGNVNQWKDLHTLWFRYAQYCRIHDCNGAWNVESFWGGSIHSKYENEGGFVPAPVARWVEKEGGGTTKSFYT